MEQTVKRVAYARHRLNGLRTGKAPRGQVFASNRTGEISPSGMIEGDVGNGLRHGLRHRRFPDEGPDTATPRRPPAPHLRPTRLFDLWVHAWRQKYAHGDVIVVRFADDIVLGFEVKSDAERFRAELAERFRKFHLDVHPEKTRLLEFGPYAAANRQRRGLRKAETFNFLGFTHMCGKKRSNGRCTVVRQTIRKRMQAKLQEVKAELRRRMHRPIREQGAWLRSVVGGHVRYYGVPMNSPALHTFRHQVGRLWLRTLRRRGQRYRLTWARMQRHIARWLPPARVCHPYPLRRLGVIT